MSKYDQLDYLTFSERNNGTIPLCAKYRDGEEIDIPDELVGTTIDNYKKCLNLKNEKEENAFSFANKNQTIINQNYFNNGHFFSDNMEPDEKKEFLLDYLNYNFGNDVDGKYFEDYLQDIFNLRQYNLIAEDFSLMIGEYLKNENKKFDLNDPEDRKKFKQFIFPQSIKFLSEEEAKNYLNNHKTDEIKKDIFSSGHASNNSMHKIVDSQNEINNFINNNIDN